MAKGRKNSRDPRELLKSVPYRNDRASVELLPEGSAIVSVPIRRPRWMVPPLSWLLPYSDRRRIQLDGLGLAVFNMCDGKMTIERIIAAFAESRRLSFREAQVSVVQFLQMLTQRGVVAIVSHAE